MPKRPTILVLVSLLFAAVGLASDPGQKPDWEKLSDHDGIAVFRWETKDSPLFAFKGETTIDAPIARVASVLADTPRRGEWVPHLIEGKVIRSISDKERIEYTSLETPPFTKNRDFVLHAKAEFKAATNELFFHFSSVDDEQAPKTNMIRGQVLNSHYRMRPEGEGKTYVEYLVHVDPKGGIPRWLVNMVQKNIPRNTLEAIRKQVKKADVVDLQMVKDLYVKPAAQAEIQTPPTNVSRSN